MIRRNWPILRVVRVFERLRRGVTTPSQGVLPKGKPGVIRRELADIEEVAGDSAEKSPVGA
jgi:hypothetical protein